MTENPALSLASLEAVCASLITAPPPLDVLSEVGIEPHAGPQEAFLRSSADIAIYGGQVGGGKSVGLLMEAARNVRNPRFEATIFRRTSPNITNPGGLWHTSMEIYPALQAEPFQSPVHQWRFPSGATVSFQHIQHDKDRLGFKGAQIPMIGWDQLEEFSEMQWWYLYGRNRSTCGVLPYIRATCNPVPPDDPEGGWLHTLLSWWIDKDGDPIWERSGLLRWFFRYDEKLLWFGSAEEANAKRIELGLSEDVKARSLTFIPARLEDNLTLMKSDPGYVARLAALPRVERMRLRGGNWHIRDTAGELVDRAWFDPEKWVDIAPARAEAVRYWDKAGTEGGGTMTAGVKMRGPVDGIWYIEDAVFGHWAELERETVIKQTAEADGKLVTIVVEQEPASGGKDSAQRTIRMLAGWKVYADKLTGKHTGKVERSGPFRAQCEAGNVVLVRGPWNEELLRHAHNFSAKPTALIDLFDAAVGAFNWLSRSGSAMAMAMSGSVLGEHNEDLKQRASWRIE